jgi:hypothetical protein
MDIALRKGIAINFLKMSVPLEITLIGILLTQSPDVIVLDKQIFTVLLYIAGLFVLVIGFVSVRALNKQDKDGTELQELKTEHEKLKIEFEAFKEYYMPKKKEDK